MAPVVAATYWFDPGDRGKPYTARIRFAGRRMGVTDKPLPGDHFEQVEVIDQVVPGSGPVSITTRALGVNPGEWLVDAEPLVNGGRRRGGAGAGGRARPPARMRTIPANPPFVRGMLAWGTSTMHSSLPGVLKSRLRPFANPPGTVIGSWPGLVGLAAIVGVRLQVILIQRAQLDSRAAVGLSAAALLAGAVGAKIWFLILSRRVSAATLTEGLCIQGFILGAALVFTPGVILLHFPLGAFLDASTPGLFVAMAIGRQGCFLTGCCAGRPTASRWGLWAPDQRVGARRVPIQLWEAVICLVIGIVSLALVLRPTMNVPGAIALGGLATYTLARQVLLAFRLEPRRSTVGRPSVLAVAGLVLVGDALCWAVTCI